MFRACPEPLMPTKEAPMLSSKAKYAVRAVALLAERGRPGGWTQMADVAKAEQIPQKFLEAILVELRGHGIVESRRGAQGGHRLLRNPADISIADIIRIMDGPLALTPCASQTRFRPCTDCVDIQQCRLQPLMRKARDAVAGVLENCSIADLTTTQPPRESVPESDKDKPTSARTRVSAEESSD
jgi:Rrf2 family protein